MHGNREFASRLYAEGVAQHSPGSRLCCLTASRYCRRLWLFVVVLSVAALGCSSPDGDDASTTGPPKVAAGNGTRMTVSRPSSGGGSTVQQETKNDPPPRRDDYREHERTFEDLLANAKEGDDPQAFGGAEFGHPQHDDAKLSVANIRKIASEHLTVYTDLPQGDVDEFPRVFDLAVPQWQSYFNLAAEKIAKWRMTAYVIKDKELFRREGLLPADLPDFAHGFQRAFEIWVYEQPSDYYRRHLLLHEGTHGVMNTLLGGAGPPWYMEGVAELLGTHQWDGEKLTLSYNPPHTDEVPYWGRVKIIRDDFAADAGMTLQSVMNYDNRAHQNVNAYAWCWAACLFLDSHPQTQRAFREMQQQVRLPAADFNRRLTEQIDDFNRIANEQWFLFVQSMEYGSQVEAAMVHYKDGAPLPAAGAVVDIQANQGWQSSGVEVEAGKKYQLRAAGKYIIAHEADGARGPASRAASRSAITTPTR